MNWRRNKYRIFVPTLHSVCRCLTAVRRSSIRNPVDTAGRTVSFPSHRLFDKPMKWFNPSAGFTAPDQFGAPDIQGCQIRPRPLALVLVLVAHYLPRRWRRGGMTTGTRLNACFFIRRQHVFIVLQSFALPHAVVQIQNHSGLFCKLRVTQKYPAAMMPSTDCISRQPPPDSRSANLSHDPLFNCSTSDLAIGKPRKKQSEFRGQFTGKSFDLHDDLRGKTSADARYVVDCPTLLLARQNAAVAISRRSAVANQVVLRSHSWCSLRSPSR